MDLKITSMQSVGYNRFNNVQKKQDVSQVTQTASDNLDISATSRSFASALKAAKETPDVRAGVVDSIRQSVNNGTYVADSRKIAEKMLSAYSR